MTSSNPSSSSNLKVSVQWARPAVFSGEDLECTITFTNVSLLRDRPPTLSLLGPLSPAAGDGFPHSTGSVFPPSPIGPSSKVFPSSVLASPPAQSNSHTVLSPTRSHAASQSLGAIQRLRISDPSLLSPLPVEKTDSDFSPLHNENSKAAGFKETFLPPNGVQDNVPRPGAGDSGQTPIRFADKILNSPNGGPGSPNRTRISTPKIKNKTLPNFQFPATSAQDKSPVSRTSTPQQGRHFRPDSTSPSQASHSRSISHSTAARHGARHLAGTSLGGTSRGGSIDWGNPSDSSSETMASEYPTPGLNGSGGSKVGGAAQPISLMMGYAQLSGSFVIDGAIINPEPFQEVKQRGVVGGQGGGGVVGVHRPRKRAGTFGFSWNTLNEGFGSLWKPKQLSSLDEMRGIADGSSIPIITTPQSLLFVDLQLAPGESRCYSCRFRLPRTLPPSHRGRSIKISYKLVISTHRRSGREQVVHSVDLPFRVLGGVDEHGGLIQYDLTQPVIPLHDIAQISPINLLDELSAMPSIPELPPTDTSVPESRQEDFLDYVSTLLNRSRNSQSPLPSPTRCRSLENVREGDKPIHVKDAIDRAIANSTLLTSDQAHGAHQFKISRDGYRVATVTLSRPFYRLGEKVVMCVDFDEADIPCLFVDLSLESFEVVDPSLALRSAASVQRVTRKIWDASSNVVIYNRRMTFSPTISRAGTPDFLTSGVCHRWIVHVEFVTPRINRAVCGGDDGGAGGAGGGGGEGGHHQAMASVYAGHVLDPADSPCHPFQVLYDLVDDNGSIVAAAVEKIGCESFEVDVPIRVYGDVDLMDAQPVVEHVV